MTGSNGSVLVWVCLFLVGVADLPVRRWLGGAAAWLAVWLKRAAWQWVQPPPGPAGPQADPATG